MKSVWILTGALLAMGCTAASGDAGDSGVDTTGHPSGAGGACGAPEAAERDDDGNRVIYLQDRFNYAFESRLDFKTVDVRAGADIRFDWSGLTTDMFGRTVDPAEGIDIVTAFLFALTEDALKEKMNNDSLSQKDVPAGAVFYTEGAATVDFLSLLSLAGGPIGEEKLLSYLDPEEYDPQNHTWAVTLAQGRIPGKGVRMVHLFRPVVDEANQAIVIGDDATTLRYSVDLHSAPRLGLPVEDPDIVVDWLDGPTTNSLGNPFVPTRITSVMVAHYAALTPVDLETRFLEMADISDALYQVEMPSGTSVLLSELFDASGQSFSGITTEGTWVLALNCGECANPAPWYLAVLDACQ